MRILASLFLLTVPMLAQSGAITGKVLDPDGVPVAGATVTARMEGSSGEALRATSGKDGSFRMAAGAGSYDLNATSASMGNVTEKGVRVDGSKATELTLTLPFNTQLGTLGEDRLAAAYNASLHHPPEGPTPRTKEGHPDFSGVWWSPRVVDRGDAAFLASADAVARERRAINGKDNPQAHCLPSAVTRIGPLFEFVQSRDYMIRISDDDSPGFYQIYLDGRGHPSDPNPAWYGHNTGTWDGDTLVVDRIGFHERVWLDQEMHPHSDKLHVIEKYRRPDLGHLEIETTVEDPGVLQKPWTQKRVADLAAGHEIYEFICPENNRDLEHMVGK